MKFAKVVFTIAGVFGLVVLVPQYFMEGRIGRDFPPPITHPEYYYGFVGVAAVWQIALLILSRDPQRYRPMMIAAVLEKASFALAVLVLFAQGRVPVEMLGPGLIDSLFGVLFLVAYLKTAPQELRA